ncbi:phosphatase PAP2 family protein [Paenibacillus sp. J2TS4]|uniref:phosphatase PAP2 family protein n=1 Tax=Paenibacillus sp. J2TS4 TaxID=2807194 RepID=UPI001B2A9959|nr:phosphatase PAP2 family protein [Paenibacillus sp. J2TS4]GIP31212.1 inositol phosphorylceramide synthase [Paenibacillus sp. J2TS4]
MRLQYRTRTASQNGWLKDNIKPLLLLLTIPLLNIIYPLLNHSGRGASQLAIGLDDWIPFWKIFILPYIAWYAFIIFVLVLLCAKDRRTYYETLFSFHIGLIVCYVIYFFYQTTVPRPELLGNDPLTALVRFIYWSDQPFNCFPSIHVLTSYLAMRGLLASSIRGWGLRSFTIIISTLIILSTLFVKQHVVLDAIAAILLGELAFVLSQAVIQRVLKGRSLKIWPGKRYSLSTTKKK